VDLPPYSPLRSASAAVSSCAWANQPRTDDGRAESRTFAESCVYPLTCQAVRGRL